jgi:hypothetical protein
MRTLVEDFKRSFRAWLDLGLASPQADDDDLRGAYLAGYKAAVKHLQSSTRLAATLAVELAGIVEAGAKDLDRASQRLVDAIPEDWL